MQRSHDAQDRRELAQKQAAKAAARRAAQPRVEGPKLTASAVVAEMVQTEISNAIDLQVGRGARQGRALAAMAQRSRPPRDGVQGRRWATAVLVRPPALAPRDVRDAPGASCRLQELMVREEETKKRALQDAHRTEGPAIRIMHVRDENGESRTLLCPVRMTAQEAATHVRIRRSVAQEPPAKAT